ncbi:hypothetical protein HJC23_001850 [Cyclotella cryptica]|uniref:DUF1279 domain-containing protein n=1 Tax=Cyclotella cryptica TaxID=29204 RepID=A0ABD3Q0D0_9STRA
MAKQENNYTPNFADAITVILHRPVTPINHTFVQSVVTTITLGRKSSGCGSLGPHETLLYPRRTFGEDVTCEGISVYIPGFGSAEVLVSLSVVLVSAEDVVEFVSDYSCLKPLNNPPLPKKQHKKGLEASLFQSLQSQDGESAKSLLAQYGIAYLATSIQLAILSFALCYVLVNRGVDVGALMSLIRFTPLVLLTVVAKLTGKEVKEGGERE